MARVKRPVRRSVERVLTDTFDLPRDAVSDLPRLMVMGNDQIRCENHRGLISCQSEQIIIGAGTGQITITGTELIVEFVRQESIEIRGTIRSIELEE